MKIMNFKFWEKDTVFSSRKNEMMYNFASGGKK